MAPKPAGEKKPAQPAKKAVAKKSTAGRKKGGSKKAVESYKIYIYKVLAHLAYSSTLLMLCWQSKSYLLAVPYV